MAAANLDAMAAADVLSRSLTVRSVISTTSGYAKRAERYKREPMNAEMEEIGEGFQGAIFEQLGTSMAMKKEKPGNENLSSNLRQEFKIHAAVEAAFDQFQVLIDCHVHVPRLLHFKPKEDNEHFWKISLQNFPAQHRQPGDMLTMEKILPVPKVVRRAMIKEFYPAAEGQPLEPATIENILRLPKNKNALLRTYFGKEDVTFTTKSFTLRNFPLCLNAMKRLKLEVESLVAEMGRAYALMHWGAGINGDDVEFVQGTYAVPSNGETTFSPDLQYRATGLFLLDFGQCNFVDLAEDCDDVYQAFRGAMVTGDNQSFIPNLKKTPALFETFKNAYVEAGRKIISEKKLEAKFNIVEFMQLYEEYAEDFLVF